MIYNETIFMKKYYFYVLIPALLALISTNFNAIAKEKQPTLQDLKQEIQQLKKEYQKKIDSLDEKLKDTQESNDETQESVEQLEVNISQQGNQKSANTFNPGVGVILNGRVINQPKYFSFEIPGFFQAEESGPGDAGFQLGESELNLNANVDDKFYASTTIAFGEGAEVEEAYLQTINLGSTSIKAGRFFSNIGYLASKHTHTDDFANRPLAYEAFLGGQFGDAGIQTTWLAPTDIFWESGFELYRGDSFPAAGAANSGNGVWTAFSHLGGDIGDSQSWRMGLSILDADVVDLTSDNGDSFTGNNQITIADFIYKWAPNGNRVDQELKLQGEYLSSNKEGLYNNNSLSPSSINFDQSGWYLEGVYRFARQWRMGIRTSKLTSEQLPIIFNNTLLDSSNGSPKQHSIMLDWSNSEFSRFRLQYDSNNLNGSNENVWILQYIAAFGAHGAHSF